jgi:hypothetical protein
MKGMLTILRAAPKALRWVNDVIEQHRPESRSLESLHFRRLQDHVPIEIVRATRIVPVEQMPRPPLERWNLHKISESSFVNAAGLTLDDMVFVHTGQLCNESLMFHELVHVIQWSILGRSRFMALYGMALLQVGYDEHPLERMAYELQSRFDRGRLGADLVPIVGRRVQEAVCTFRRTSLSNRMAELLARTIL